MNNKWILYTQFSVYNEYYIQSSVYIFNCIHSSIYIYTHSSVCCKRAILSYTL